MKRARLELEALVMMKARIFLSGTLLAGSIALLTGLTNEASAQFYPRPHIFGGFYSGEVFIPPVPRRPVGMGARAIMEETGGARLQAARRRFPSPGCLRDRCPRSPQPACSPCGRCVRR